MRAVNRQPWSPRGRLVETARNSIMLRNWNTFQNLTKSKLLGDPQWTPRNVFNNLKKHRHLMEPPCNKSKTRSGKPIANYTAIEPLSPQHVCRQQTKHTNKTAISMCFVLHHIKQDTHFIRCHQPTGLRKTFEKKHSNQNWKQLQCTCEIHLLRYVNPLGRRTKPTTQQNLLVGSKDMLTFVQFSNK